MRRVHRALQQHVFLLQPATIQLLPDAELQHLRVERLLDVVVDAELLDPLDQVRRSVGGDHDRDHRRIDAARVPEDLQPVEIRHSCVGHDEIERALVQVIERTAAVLRDGEVASGNPLLEDNVFGDQIHLDQIFRSI